MEKKLSEKKIRFVENYLINPNVIKAAIKAGFAESTARSKAPMWVCKNREKSTDKAVWDAVAAARVKRAKETKIDAAYVLTQLAGMQEALISDLYDDDGTMKDVSKWPVIWQRMVNGIEIIELFEGSGKDRTHIGYTKKIKLMDRSKVMHMLGQHTDVQAFKENLELNVKGNLIDTILAARNRGGK